MANWEDPNQTLQYAAYKYKVSDDGLHSLHWYLNCQKQWIIIFIVFLYTWHGEPSDRWARAICHKQTGFSIFGLRQINFRNTFDSTYLGHRHARIIPTSSSRLGIGSSWTQSTYIVNTPKYMRCLEVNPSTTVVSFRCA